MPGGEPLIAAPGPQSARRSPRARLPTRPLRAVAELALEDDPG